MTQRLPHVLRAIVGVIMALVVVNIARSTVIPSGGGFLTNVLGATIIVAGGVTIGGLHCVDLGLCRAHLWAGARYGLCAFGLVTLCTLVVAAVPAGRDALNVDAVHLTGGGLITKIALIIPIGTVLTEELMFRGVLHGLLTKVLSPALAMLIGAVTFGLWHVFPAWRADGVGVALGTFVVTAIAGAGFVWLRNKSQSVVAPMLAHLATNTVPLTAGWIVWR